MQYFIKVIILCTAFSSHILLADDNKNVDVQSELDSLCGVKSCDIVFSKMKKFARNGSAHAQAVMALLYRGGYGTDVNESRSYTYMKRAAKQGFPYAQYYLGLIYREGKLADKDESEADMWLGRAAKSGYKKAIEILYHEGKLTKEQADEYERKYREPEINPGDNVLQITKESYSLSDLVDLLATLGYGNDRQTGSRIRGRGCGNNITSCLSWNINSPIGRTQFSTMISKINALETAMQMAGQTR